MIGLGTGLQGQAVFKNKITFRPHSTDSQTYHKMNLSIADSFSKAQKIRVLPVTGKDSESQRSERIKVRGEEGGWGLVYVVCVIVSGTASTC